MEKMYKNKTYFLIVITVLFAIPFIYLLNLHPTKLNEGFYWISTFIMSFLFLYVIFISSTLIQIVVIKISHIFPIRVFTIYPFTFDGNFRFHPIRLIYNTDGFNNGLFLNLAIYKDEETIMEKLKTFTYLRKTSYFLSYFIIYMLLPYHDLKTQLAFAICYIATILLSYFQYGTFWYGYDYIKGKGPQYIYEYLFSSKTLFTLSAKDYSDKIKELDCSEPFFSLCIMENYLYASIIEKKLSLPIEDFIKIFKYYEKEEYNSYNLSVDSKIQSMKRLIGWAGVKCNDSTYISTSVDLLTDILSFIENDTIQMISSRYSKRLIKEIKYLKNYPAEHNLLQLLYYHNIFSIYENIFQDTI